MQLDSEKEVTLVWLMSIVVNMGVSSGSCRIKLSRTCNSMPAASNVRSLGHLAVMDKSTVLSWGDTTRSVLKFVKLFKRSA